MTKTWQKIKIEPSVKEKYLIHEKVLDTVRDFFKKQGFREVSTPILVPNPSAEPNLEAFKTELRTAGGQTRDGYLILSPEYSLKKLLTAGLGNIFEITKCFRNEEEVSRLHNPEFTMLEWYRINADYKEIMNDFEKLFNKIIKNSCSDFYHNRFKYQGETYDISMPWIRLSVSDSFNKYAAIDTETLLSEKKLLKTGKDKGYKVKNSSWEQMFYQIFLNEIEPRLRELRKPVFIYDYPLPQASLAKKCKHDNRFAERFEVYLAGIELGNCFSELTDANEQKARLEKDLLERKKRGKTKYGMDKDFIEALALGMPDASGIAVGLDRLVMLAADAPDISDTLFFPAKELFDLTDG